MQDAPHENPLDKIDIAMFFGLLKEKLDENQYDAVTAALAESVSRSAIGRVLNCSHKPRARIAKLRKALRAKVSSATV